MALKERLESYATPLVVMGAGVPGSGKTTILKPLAAKIKANYLSVDAIREELAGDASDQTINTEAWSLLYERAAEHLNGGESLVIDATHATESYRREGIERYRSMGAQAIVAIWVRTGPKEAKRRNNKRDRIVPPHAIDVMDRQLRSAPLSLEEGFDAIIKI